MLRIRRVMAIAAGLGALLLPFTFTAAQPAAAYCVEPQIDDGNPSRCSNPCNDIGGLLAKAPALEPSLNCPQ